MNSWIQHVKAVASKKGISYREALKVASASYKKKRIVKGKGAEEERAERAQMLEEELGMARAYHQVKPPAKMLDRSQMTGQMWDRVKNSPTLDHYRSRNWPEEDLFILYDNLPQEIKSQYDEPRTIAEVFHILKTQRGGMYSRRR